MPTMTEVSQYMSSQTPYVYIPSRNRDWYVPYMIQAHASTTFWYNLIKYRIDMSGVHAERAHFTEQIQPTADPTELAFRGLDVPRQYYDSRSWSVVYKSYGGGVQYHKYDPMIYQWAMKAEENPSIINAGVPQPDLVNVITGGLARNVVETLDLVARHPFIGTAKNRIIAGSKAGFHALAVSDTFDPGVAKTVQYAAAYGNEPGEKLIPCVTSPAAVDACVNLPTTDRYTRALEATNNSRLLNYVAGEYMGVTFMANPQTVLYNVGTVLATASITSPIEPGDGAPDPETVLVDGHYSVGAAGATHYIQLSSISDPTTAETGFKVGDIVTICREKATSNTALTTTGAAVWNSAKNIQARIVAVDYDNNRISIENPVLNENYYTAISSGLYGYVVKARPVHIAVFFNYGLANTGVAGVVMEQPKMYVNEPRDNRKALWNFSWDCYMGYGLTDPDAFIPYFFTGPIVRRGANGLEVVSL